MFHILYILFIYKIILFSILNFTLTHEPCRGIIFWIPYENFCLYFLLFHFWENTDVFFLFPALVNMLIFHLTHQPWSVLFFMSKEFKNTLLFQQAQCVVMVCSFSSYIFTCFVVYLMWHLISEECVKNLLLWLQIY